MATSTVKKEQESEENGIPFILKFAGLFAGIGAVSAAITNGYSVELVLAGGVTWIGYAMNQKRQERLAEIDELEYYGALRFPVIIIQTDRRTHESAFEIAEKMGTLYKGITIHYAAQVTSKANFFRSKLKQAENVILTAADVHEIYFQDIRFNSIENESEYAERIGITIVKIVKEYKVRLAEGKKENTDFIKSVLYNQK